VSPPQGAVPAAAADFDTAVLYSQYATAAYCPRNTQGKIGEKVTCPNGQCELASKATIVAKFDKYEYTRRTWVIAINTNFEP
jgi:hypothetical protein